MHLASARTSLISHPARTRGSSPYGSFSYPRFHEIHTGLPSPTPVGHRLQATAPDGRHHFSPILLGGLRHDFPISKISHPAHFSWPPFGVFRELTIYTMAERSHWEGPRPRLDVRVLQNLFQYRVFSSILRRGLKSVHALRVH